MSALSLGAAAAPRKRRAGGTGEIVTIAVPSVSDELVSVISGAAGGSFASQMTALAAQVWLAGGAISCACRVPRARIARAADACARCGATRVIGHYCNAIASGLLLLLLLPRLRCVVWWWWWWAPDEIRAR